MLFWEGEGDHKGRPYEMWVGVAWDALASILYQDGRGGGWGWWRVVGCWRPCYALSVPL